MPLPVYSSKDVAVLWAGVALTGLADGTFVSFNYNADITNEKIGADGSLEVSLSPDNTGTCTITLLQESEGNLILSGVLHAIKKGGFFQAPITIVDPSGSVLAFLHGAYLKSAPTVALGIETEAREWTFFVERLEFASAPTKIAKLAKSVSDRISGGTNIIKKAIL